MVDMKKSLPARSINTPSWLRDERFLRILGQIVFLVFLGVIINFLGSNMIKNMDRQGLSVNFNFLRSTAGFDIGEHLIGFTRSDSFARAFLVGAMNTLLVTGLGVFFATLLGIIFGIARLSTNFLIRQISQAYIEFLRNIPLLVLLIFLYLGLFIQFPRVRQAIVLPGPVMLSNRGVAIPWGVPTASFSTYLILLGISLVIAVGVWVGLTIYGKRKGRAPLAPLWSLLTFFGLALLSWLVLPAAPLTIDLPALQGLRIAGGMQMSPEFMTLLTGLAIYTSAFIADVVRAGIQSISRGQIEAARSLGLSGMLSLRLIIFPQALRVMIPPLTSQYLNLLKNSSLAVAIGYPDLFHVSGTIMNQSGRAVEMVTLSMLTYLSISLVTSAFMNWYNQRVRLVER